MTSQDYQKLPDLRSIRVIKLHSATSPEDAICFDLITISLDTLPTPTYEALSYTWSGQLLDQVVYVNGREFLVTENARNAMRRLRPYKPGKFRHIWIDAICINQKDDDEKSAQVQMMLKIYTRATRVNIWLGEGDETSDFVIRWLRWTGLLLLPLIYVRQIIELTGLLSQTQRRKSFFFFLLQTWDKLMLWVSLFILVGPVLPFRALPIFKGFKRKIQIGVDNLSTREYWERSWTVQEASVNLNTFVYCGSSKPLLLITFMMGHFVVVAFYILFGFEQILARYQYHLPTYNFFIGAEFVLLESLYKTKAALPVDKIYAVRAMYPGSLGMLPVDYSRSAKDVFIDAARLILKGNKTVEFLRYACTGNRTDGFPTWMPAWDAPSVVPERLSRFAPAAVFPYSIVDQDSETEVLKLKALWVDTVTGNTSALFPSRPPPKRYWLSSKSDSMNSDEAFEVFKTWAVASPNVNGDAYDNRSKLRQFAFLMAGMRYLKADEIICEWFPMVLEYSDYGLGPQFGSVRMPLPVHRARWFAGNFLQLTSGRALFTTESGRVGMSTMVVCEGDEVALLSGERIPYLIRKCPDRPGKYTVVCPCWISGAVKEERWPLRSGDGVEEDLEFIELV